VELLLCLLGGLVEAQLLDVLSQLIKVLNCERVQVLGYLLEFAVDHLIRSYPFALAALQKEFVLAVGDALFPSTVGDEEVHVV